MSIPLVINGVAFEYPENFDTEWGIDATGWAQAVTNGMLQMAGGNFPLTAQVNFGGSFGITTLNVISHSANPASTGFIRLAKSDVIEWRNNANSANLPLAIDGSDMLTFNGVVLGLTSLTNNHIFVGNASNQPTDVAMSGDATIVASGALTIANGAINNAKVASGAAIAVNKLAAMTANRAIASDSSGFLTPSATTDTELGFVSGVTSSIQGQINSISTGTIPSGSMLDFAGSAAPSGWLLCDGSSYTTASQPTLFAAIGYLWGGSGPNFNVPNMTRRVGMGAGGSGSGTIGNAVGNTGGAETVAPTISITDLGHNHTQNGHQHIGTSGVGSGQIYTGINGVWPHGYTNVTTTLGEAAAAGTGSTTAGFANTSTVTATNNSNTTGITATGSGSVIQPAAIVLKIIKT